jgi:hypothetical protein
MTPQRRAYLPARDEPGTPGWQLALATVESGSEVVIRKSTDDGFAGTRTNAPN